MAADEGAGRSFGLGEDQRALAAAAREFAAARIAPPARAGGRARPFPVAGLRAAARACRASTAC